MLPAASVARATIVYVCPSVSVPAPGVVYVQDVVPVAALKSWEAEPKLVPFQ